MTTHLHIPAYPAELTRSALFKLKVDGLPVDVFHTGIADFAQWEMDDKPTEVVITPP